MEPGANTTYVRLSRRPGRGPADAHAPRAGELPRLPRHHPQRRLAHGRGGGDRRAARGRLRRRARRVDPGAGGRGARRAHLVPRLRAGPRARARPGRRGRPPARGDPARHAGVPARRSPSCSRPRPAPSTDGEAAWARRAAHEADLLARCTRRAGPAPRRRPRWIRQLVLAADQFVARRPLPDEPDGHDGDRRLPVVRRLGPRHDDRAARPGADHRASRAGRGACCAPSRASSIAACCRTASPTAATPPSTTRWTPRSGGSRRFARLTPPPATSALLKELWPVLESVVEWHRRGTRYGIGEDPADGLLRAGEPGVQLTWMDARVGDWVVTPRIGKPVEINALWYNALRAMAGFARALERPHEPWDAAAERVRRELRPLLVRGGRPLLRRDRWARRRRRRAAAQPDLRRLAAREPAVARAAAPRGRRLRAPSADLVRAAQPRARPSGVLRVLQRRAARAGRRLSPGHGVGLAARTVRAGPRARVRRSRGRARAARADAPPPRRLRRRLASPRSSTAIAPFTPRGCPAQAWSVAETLRAWQALAGGPPPRGPRRRTSRRRA